METKFKQTKTLLEQSQEILITSGPNPTADAISGALALSYFLKNLGKNTSVIIDQFSAPNHLFFLPEINVIKDSLTSAKKLVFSVDLSKTKMNDLTYEIKGDQLHIFLTPQNGWWNERDFTAKPSAYSHDLTIVLNTKSVESLGEPFKTHADFFYRVPIINIDNNLNNEQFGQINLVDITAVSLCEILYNFFKNFEIKIDENLATCLLTGLIASTNCFKSSRLSPQTLQTAGELIKLGAKRDEIVANLYRKHSIKSLQLWGRALSRLKFDSAYHLAWTTLTREDFLLTGSNETYLPEVIDELVLNAPEAKIAILIYEQSQGGICCVLKTQKNISASSLIKKFEGSSQENTFQFCLTHRDPIDAEKEVVEEVKTNLKEILN